VQTVVAQLDRAKLPEVLALLHWSKLAIELLHQRHHHRPFLDQVQGRVAAILLA
jgi:hypothetical protein